jgi:hypothetical protein
MNESAMQKTKPNGHGARAGSAPGIFGSLLPRRRRCRRGVALPLAIFSLVFLGIFLGAMSFFTRQERHSAIRLVTQKRLFYLARAGLALAEARLLRGRWYSPSTQGRFTYDDPSGFGRVTVYCDDFVRVKPLEAGGTSHRLLDHVKVSVLASYQGENLYGFGKFVISPEPLYPGNGSTQGVNFVKPFGAGGSPNLVPTLRKLINVHLLLADEIGRIPGFTTIDDVSSRQALAAAMIPEQLAYAFHYAVNEPISRAVRHQQPVCSQPRTTLDFVRSYLNGAAGGTPARLPASPSTAEQNALKNRFLTNVLRNFFLTHRWDLPLADRRSILSRVQVVIGKVPEKCHDPEVISAFRQGFGDPHPIILRPGYDYQEVYTGGGGISAFDRYLADRGWSSTVPSTASSKFAADLSEMHTANVYRFLWEGVSRAAYTGDEPLGERPSAQGAVSVEGAVAAYLQFLRGGQQTISTDPNYRYIVSECRVISKDGPEPEYSGMYFLDPTTGGKMALLVSTNFFLKFVDEFTAAAPVEPKPWTNWAATSYMNIDANIVEQTSQGEVVNTF